MAKCQKIARFQPYMVYVRSIPDLALKYKMSIAYVIHSAKKYCFADSKVIHSSPKETQLFENDLGSLTLVQGHHKKSGN